MNIIEIINKKKWKQALTEKEFDFFIQEFVVNKTIKDYQASSLLMAIRLNGLNDQEIYFLTKAIYKYSEKYEFPKKRILVDKHSSGGVGDKISIIILPIINALGYGIAKIAGRGLSHTGGTIDKLESIDVKTDFNLLETMKIFEKNEFVLMQQTKDLVPADQILYALRDVTGTTDSLGLIASSIISKKLVFNSDYIMIDLKIGSGAFMKTIEEAERLANVMIGICNKFNRKIVVHITSVNDVIGTTVGNAIEIQESINYLLNLESDRDLKILINDFLVTMLIDLDPKITDEKSALSKIEKVISSGLAYKCFLTWIKNQGGNLKAIGNKSFFNPKYLVKVLSEKAGFISFKSTENVGLISCDLGAGRKVKNGKIQFSSGIRILEKSGSWVEKNMPIAILYSENIIENDIIKKYLNNLNYSDVPLKEIPLILGRLSN